MDQDRPPPRRASNRSCVAHRRADLPETGLRSSQRVLARTTDVSASSLPEATLPTMQASLQSTLHAPTIFESWLPMDSDIFRKGNCNARLIRVHALLTRTSQKTGSIISAMPAICAGATSHFKARASNAAESSSDRRVMRAAHDSPQTLHHRMM